MQTRSPFCFRITAALLVSAFLPGIALAQGAGTPTPASAAKPVYAVLSLIGDKLEIVVAMPKTGTNIDPNRHESLAIAESVFDDTVVSSIAAAARKIKPDAELTALNTRSPVLFEKFRTLFAVSDETIQIPDAIRAALKAQGATHLFLVTKQRDDASAQFRDGFIEGTGKLEGLGYYLDGSIETSNGTAGQSGRGFIAPFAYFNIALIDLATSKQLKKQKVTASWPVSAGNAVKDIGSPWAALSSAEKVRLVNRLIDREINRVMPQLLQ
ncbi:MAG: hypothetical protein ABI905_16555 [Betaproteobacteria bacterium]